MASEHDTMILRGGKPLRGEITVRGAKNNIPKSVVATLLTSEECTLTNVAHIEDVEIVSDMIRAMGGEVRQDDGTLVISTKNIQLPTKEQFQSFSGRSRIPILFAGPLLVRFGKAMIPKLGGCNIGSRPVDFHIAALKEFGAEVTEDEYFYYFEASKLRGTKIALNYPSVGATEQVLFAASCAEGVTELSNAAVEPEVMELVALLQKMGAIISVDTDRVITIVGVPSLGGYEHAVMTDRIEAASWACAAAATDGEIYVKGARQMDMTTFLNKFRQVGGDFDIKNDGIIFRRGKKGLSSIALETDVHPGFMTDWQQPFVVLLTQAHGVSIVHETVYEKRFGYIDALNRMGAHIQLYQECLGSKKCRFGQRNHFHSAVISGPSKLRGTEITIPDLRAGFSYVIAALVAEGESTLHNMNLIRRGYEDFRHKLEALGVQIVK